MTNLRNETVQILLDNEKSPSDVLWVGTLDGGLAVSWDEFFAISDIEYDSGYGGTEIPADLVVVGDNWWLERGEYDGAEWWEFKTLPILREDSKKFSFSKNAYGSFEMEETA